MQRDSSTQRVSFQSLISIHQLAHKKTANTKSVAFDGLACAGCGDYLKLSYDGTWKEDGTAMRSYRKESKEALTPWIIETLSQDEYGGPPPIVEHTQLLKYKRAGELARAALGEGVTPVYYPLGMEMQEVRNFRAIKGSAFIFQDPEQWKAFNKAVSKFEDETACGLEMLALRRSYGGRTAGSLQQIAETVFRAIQNGERSFRRRLNLGRPNASMREIATQRKVELDRRKRECRQDLFHRIDANREGAHHLTGYIVTSDDIRSLSQDEAREAWLIHPVVG